MLFQRFPAALVLTGPTGSGKTGLGIELAEGLGAEIISMDSMALYRGMDIGTAKPMPRERQRVPHHLVDVLDPWESASVAWWLSEAMRCASEINKRGKRILFVGGTPLYLKALLYGLFKGPPANVEIRRRLGREAQEQGRNALHSRLRQVDPVTAGRVHVHDLRRVIRALEVWETTGKPISEWQTEWNCARFAASISEQHLSSTASISERTGKPRSASCRVLWLDMPRYELYSVIDCRVRSMFTAGLVEEVRALRSLARPLSREASQAVGYKEVLSYLDGESSLEETVALIQKRSRNLAKRQLSWFRNLSDCRRVTRELTFVAWGLKMEQ
jgi:tRNA dimethylallyltransferase